MSQTQPPRIGRTARWLLLACTVFGLAVMHTLGHTGVQVAMAAGAGMHPHTAGSPATTVQEAAAGAPTCAGNGCTDHHGAMSGWSVCLAVLSGLAVVLVVVLLWVRRARLGHPGSWRVLAGGAPRPPPVRAVGLTVASNAVLRI